MAAAGQAFGLARAAPGIKTSVKKPHVSRTLANFFSESIVNAWNFLPDIVDFSSLFRFKRSIHKVDYSRFHKCFKVFL